MALSDITIASASVFVGGTPPADGTWMTISAAGIPESASGVSMAALNIGMTGAAATYSYDRKLREVIVQQALAPVKVVAISEEVSISITGSELLLTTLQKFLSGTAITEVTSPTPKYSGVASVNNPVETGVPLVLVTKDPGTGFYRGFLIYLAYVADKIELVLDNQKETMYKITVKGLADITRTSAVTGNLSQIVAQHA